MYSTEITGTVFFVFFVVVVVVVVCFFVFFRSPGIALPCESNTSFVFLYCIVLLPPILV